MDKGNKRSETLRPAECYGLVCGLEYILSIMLCWSSRLYQVRSVAVQDQWCTRKRERWLESRKPPDSFVER